MNKKKLLVGGAILAGVGLLFLGSQKGIPEVAGGGGMLGGKDPEEIEDGLYLDDDTGMTTKNNEDTNYYDDAIETLDYSHETYSDKQRYINPIEEFQPISTKYSPTGTAYEGIYEGKQSTLYPIGTAEYLKKTDTKKYEEIIGIGMSVYNPKTGLIGEVIPQTSGSGSSTKKTDTNITQKYFNTGSSGKTSTTAFNKYFNIPSSHSVSHAKSKSSSPSTTTKVNTSAFNKYFKTPTTTKVNTSAFNKYFKTPTTPPPAPKKKNNSQNIRNPYTKGSANYIRRMS
jgi:hypothetical protein